ncbi:hypothetical protein EM595_1622 [Duffyella gerundensis]|uniref:Uncharacterized protein n=1 Tax=Duffyella gerundensis TaxID=1619313 RepID=A0A0U5L3Y3_9GAMM|nr:hypothetical protein EM595_1622 [Duffyella gerundensis]
MPHYLYVKLSNFASRFRCLSSLDFHPYSALFGDFLT